MSDQRRFVPGIPTREAEADTEADRLWGPGNWVRCERCDERSGVRGSRHHKDFHERPTPTWVESYVAECHQTALLRLVNACQALGFVAGVSSTGSSHPVTSLHLYGGNGGEVDALAAILEQHLAYSQNDR